VIEQSLPKSRGGMLRQCCRLSIRVMSALSLFLSVSVAILGTRSATTSEVIQRTDITINDLDWHELTIHVRFSQRLVGVFVSRQETQIGDMPPDLRHRHRRIVRWAHYSEDEAGEGVPRATTRWMGLQFHRSSLDARPRTPSRVDSLALFMPFWYASVGLALPSAVGRGRWLARRHRRTRRRSRGLCINCGYDLHGTAGRCPECGVQAQAAPAGAINVDRTE
jgi:hypothetical protein